MSEGVEPSPAKVLDLASTNTTYRKLKRTMMVNTGSSRSSWSQYSLSLRQPSRSPRGLPEHTSISVTENYYAWQARGPLSRRLHSTPGLQIANREKTTQARQAVDVWIAYPASKNYPSTGSPLRHNTPRDQFCCRKGAFCWLQASKAGAFRSSSGASRASRRRETRHEPHHQGNRRTARSATTASAMKRPAQTGMVETGVWGVYPAASISPVVVRADRERPFLPKRVF